jgi:hypothetical protein
MPDGPWRHTRQWGADRGARSCLDETAADEADGAGPATQAVLRDTRALGPSSSVTPPRTMHIQRLPQALLTRVLGYLTGRDLGRVLRVSCKLKRAGEARCLWQDLGIPRAHRLLHASLGIVTTPVTQLLGLGLGSKGGGKGRGGSREQAKSAPAEGEGGDGGV